MCWCQRLERPSASTRAGLQSGSCRCLGIACLKIPVRDNCFWGTPPEVEESENRSESGNPTRTEGCVSIQRHQQSTRTTPRHHTRSYALESWCARVVLSFMDHQLSYCSEQILHSESHGEMVLQSGDVPLMSLVRHFYKSLVKSVDCSQNNGKTAFNTLRDF